MCRICDNDPDLHTPSLARRRFLEVAGLGTAAALTLGLTPPNEQPSDATERTLDLYRIHSRKRLRVTYLEVAGLGTAAALTLGLTPPNEQPSDATERTLDLYRIHSRKRLRVTYMKGGKYVDAALSQIDLICQDNLQKQHIQMDTTLIDQLWMLKELVARDAVIDIVSAYRTPKTNAWLRGRSKNVARRSLHIDGRAIDIRIRGLSASTVADLAAELAMGGVGYYDRSQFTHIDTGRPRRWNI